MAEYKKAGICGFGIGSNIVDKQLLDANDFSKIEAVMPGFLNLDLSESFLQNYLEEMRTAPDFGVEKVGEGKTVVVDYGGANVAKPLHIGHLRSAIIGESIKRLYKFFGYNTIGDIHLGDWGLQMGLIIAELQERQPDLPYFDPDFTGEYPTESPFTISELEEIYPAASAKKKEDLSFADRAHTATFELQSGRRGYRAIWDHIMRISVADMTIPKEKYTIIAQAEKKVDKIAKLFQRGELTEEERYESRIDIYSTRAWKGNYHERTTRNIGRRQDYHIEGL